MVSSVNEVAEEQVIIRFNISGFVWGAPKIEEAHEILVLAVDVAEDFNWCIDLEDHGLTLDDLLGLVSEREDVLPSEGKVRLAVDRGRPLFWSQEMVQEELVKGVNTLSVLAFSVATSEIEDLRSLSFLLLDLSFSNRDLHFGFAQALHGRCGRPRVVGSTGRLTGSSVRCSALSVSGLSLESILNLLHQLLVAFDMRNQVEFND